MKPIRRQPMKKRWDDWPWQRSVVVGCWQLSARVGWIAFLGNNVNHELFKVSFCQSLRPPFIPEQCSSRIRRFISKFKSCRLLSMDWKVSSTHFSLNPCHALWPASNLFNKQNCKLRFPMSSMILYLVSSIFNILDFWNWASKNFSVSKDKGHRSQDAPRHIRTCTYLFLSASVGILTKIIRTE